MNCPDSVGGREWRREYGRIKGMAVQLIPYDVDSKVLSSAELHKEPAQDIGK